MMQSLFAMILNAMMFWSIMMSQKTRESIKWMILTVSVTAALRQELSFTAPSSSPCVIDEVSENRHTEVESVMSSHIRTGSLLNSNGKEDCQGHYINRKTSLERLQICW